MCVFSLLNLILTESCSITTFHSANCLVAGYSMRSLTDICGISREKLAFLVDATAAPIASIVPISSWVGFEISLIQKQLDAIYERYPDPTVSDSGFSVFLETIKYRYYCIFMLMFIPLLIASGVSKSLESIANIFYSLTDSFMSTTLFLA